MVAKGLQSQGDAVDNKHDKISQQQAVFVELWDLKDSGAVRVGLDVITL